MKMNTYEFSKHNLPINIRTLAVRSYNPAVRRSKEGCFSNNVHTPTATKIAPQAQNKMLKR